MMDTHPQALPKSERVRRRAEYLHIQGGGRKHHTDNFLVFVTRTGVATTRVGITVSRKVGNAVVRNRVKRLVREVYRRRKGALPVGHDLVFLAKRTAAGVDYARVDREIEKLCAQLSRT